MIALALGIAAAAAGCSGIQTLDASTVKTVALAELPAAVAPSAEGAAPVVGPGPMIVHVKAGERIPLRLALEAPFAEIAAGENAIVFTRDVYLYIDPSAVLIGFDGVRFARLGDWDAIQELAGIEGGQLSIGFGAGVTEGPRIDVRLKMQ
jgi:hypothetical protein